jgi:uncharacterized Zn finger protein (UPF0148 family)
MLDLTCPACGNPLFKLKNSDVYCPSCEKKVIIEKKEPILEKTKKIVQKGKDRPNNDLDTVLRQKLDDLQTRLAKETDIYVVFKILKTIKLVISILKDINPNQG